MALRAQRGGVRTFLEDLIRTSSPARYPKEHPQTPGSISRKVFGVHLVIDVNSDDIHLVRIHVAKKDVGKGLGSKALKWLCWHADQHGLLISLFPNPTMHRRLNEWSLIQWYARHGFAKIGEWHIRKPKKRKTRS